MAVVIIVPFGSRKLPDTARALGRSMRILKSEARAMEDDGAAAQSCAAPAGDASGDASGQPAPRVIQAAPGDTASARTVSEDDTGA